MISEAFNPSHSRSFWCNADREQSHKCPTSSLMWRRGSGIWEDPISGQVKVQWLTLCYSSLRLWSLCCCGHQHGIHISWVSPENANYGRNQLQTLQIPALKKWKNSDKRATTVTMFDKMLHWRMKLEGTNAKYWLRRNTSQQQQQIQLYCKPPERWPNWGMLVRRLQWNYVWRIFLTKWLKLVLHA